MRENLVKEYLAEGFVRLLMAKNRFKIFKSDSGDDGVDLSIQSVIKNLRKDGKYTYTDSGRMLHIQMKCTTEKYVKDIKSGFEYSLKVKNYEDIVRAKDQPYIKILLIVFILPEDENQWVNILEDHIKISKYAYWYFPSDRDNLRRSEYKSGSSKIKIELLKKNKLDLDFKNIFDLFT
ncbi:MAG: DUF4365 domain-containing protein [Pseudosphingobacterium sp.]|nr:DUF4365 domain-containing protein [Pseudosphingobacterium sp.]